MKIVQNTFHSHKVKWVFISNNQKKKEEKRINMSIELFGENKNLKQIKMNIGKQDKRNIMTMCFNITSVPSSRSNKQYGVVRIPSSQIILELFGINIEKIMRFIVDYSFWNGLHSYVLRLPIRLSSPNISPII